jgi:hypothetical protein
VRGDALLGDAVHLVRADLHLDALAARADDRRVERLVHVRLGERDVVLEAPGTGVHSEWTTPRPRSSRDDSTTDAERDDVVHLLEVALLRLHLAPDRVEVLRAARSPRRRSPLGELLRSTLALTSLM